MMGVLKSFSERLLGRGSAALTVPPMDGALKPNNRLESASTGIAAQEPRALVIKEGQLLWAENHRLMSEAGEAYAADGLITAAAVSPEGCIAWAAEGHGIALDGVSQQALAKLPCVTALAFEDANTLWIAVGSTVNAFNAWSRDFLEMRRSGQLLRYDISRQKLTLVADRLAFPYGLLVTAKGIVLSESWKRSLVCIDSAGRQRTLIDNLPGYPAGLAAAEDGSVWLSLFAPCNPLLELVLREPEYRRAMMAEVDPRYWIAPALRSGQSFLEPMQGGALKQMGILKPWAPSLSYGLVIQMSPAFSPVQSLHSRAGGRRHGVTSVVEHDGMLCVASTGGNEVLRLHIGEGGGR